MATASLVLGLVSVVGIIGFTGSVFFVLLGFLAIAISHLALNRIRRSEDGLGGRRRAIGGVVGGYGTVALSLLFILVLMPMIGRARATAELAFCRANLQQIGYACQMYTNSNKGFLPPSLDALNDYLGPPASAREMTICPAAKDQSAPSYELVVRTGKMSSYKDKAAAAAWVREIEKSHDGRRCCLYMNGVVEVETDASGA